MKKWLIVMALLGGLMVASCVRKRVVKKRTPGKIDKNVDALALKGKGLYSAKGCIACHTVDGSPRIGPTLAGLFGKKQKVTTQGQKREIIVDANYLHRAIKTPQADIVEGYEKVKMVITSPLTEEDIQALVAYIKTLSQPGSAPKAKGMAVIQYKACLTCHSLDGISRVAPTFKGLYGSKVKVITDGKERTVTVDDAYLRRSIRTPNADVVKGYHPYMMPQVDISDAEISAVISFLKNYKGGPIGIAPPQGEEGPPISMAEMGQAKKIYFNRCAGCHGMLRKGATGPALLPKRLQKKYTGDTAKGIQAVVSYGLPGGMPAWGKLGTLNAKEIELLSRYLQHSPPAPPEMSLSDMIKSWKVYVAPEKRPTKAFHKNWENFFGVVLRAAGQVAIIDGTTKKLINIVNTGFAVHILRSSASGRYFYSIGRDGRVTMIDLWMEKPDKVAEVKVCYDARSVDASKFKGYEDKYLIVGGYWPPSLIIMDGHTLKPLKVVCTSSYTYTEDPKDETGKYVREARAAAIVSSHNAPEWVVNIKEAGYIWLVNYSDIKNLTITAVPCERFLHDGGWDSTKRYVLMAANAKNTIAVVDTKTRKRVALVKVGKTPHPGRGANVNHPTYGPLWLTGHIGENLIVAIGTDPEGHPKNAWKVVKKIKLPGAGGGNLFIKTHPKSRWIWADRPLHPDSKVCRSIYIIDKKTFKVVKTIVLPAKYPGRAVHFEYNKEGTEVWVAVWVAKKSGKPSAIFIFDDKNLDPTKEVKPIKVITGKWLVTPTGKFNVFNTVHDIY